MYARMKKNVFLWMAVCMVAMVLGCKDKAKSQADAEADAQEESLEAEEDGAEADDVLMPMFFAGLDGDYQLMLYWSNLVEPELDEEYPQYYEQEHRRWARQEQFRRHAAEYVNLLADDGRIIKVKFVDEVLKDPDGNQPSIGEIHGRPEIPSLCARFTYVNPRGLSDDDRGSLVVVTDDYLKSRRQLDVEVRSAADGNYLTLPARVVRQMEQRYGMHASRSMLTARLDDRYTVGAIQFEGEWKDAPRDEYDHKKSLALEVIVDGDKVYAHEEIGYYEDGFSGWNADDEGEYIPCHIAQAFEGPQGLELCYSHGAPESFEVGMFYLRDGEYTQDTYETYHRLIDEQIPVWKKDIAQMQKLVDDAGSQGLQGSMLTQWAHFYLDYDHEWLWLRSADEQSGAFFLRKDGQLKLITTYAPYQKVTEATDDDVHYLIVSGSLVEPTFATEAFGFRNGREVEHVELMQSGGILVPEDCRLNGSALSQERAQRYLNTFIGAEELTAYFNDTEAEQ